MLPRYYLNDYFTLIDSPLVKEREYMKTDIFYLFSYLTIKVIFDKSIPNFSSSFLVFIIKFLLA